MDKEKKISLKKFTRFLKEKHVFAQYKRNFDPKFSSLADYRVPSLKQFFEIYGADNWLFSCFDWSYTPQTEKMWCSINRLWISRDYSSINADT